MPSIKASEIQFRQLIEFAPHAMVVVNEQGVILLVNSQVLSWFGYSRNEVIGRAVEMLLPERFRAAHPQFLAAYVTKPTLRPMGTGRELLGRRKDGSEFPVDISLSPVNAPDGLQIIASIVDMTEHRRVQIDLQQTNAALESANRDLAAFRLKLESEMAEKASAETRFRQFVEMAPHAMVVVDREGMLTLVNSQVLSWFGYAREELIGKPVETLIPERFRAKHPTLLHGFVDSPSMRPMGTGRDLYGRRKDGSEFPVDISLSPVQTADGLQVIASIADMSERRRTAEALQHTNLALGSVNTELEAIKRKLQAEVAERTLTEQRFRQLVEFAPYAKVIVDRAGTLLLVNSQVLAWFGYTREELIGQPVEMLIPQRFRSAHPNYLQAYVREPSLRPMGTGRDLHGLRKDGTEFPVDISLSPIHTAEGLQIIAAIVDTSAHKQAEEKLKQANREIEAVNKELESFAYSVSHDLRAPLRAMTGFSNILLRDKAAALDTDGKGYLARIQKASERMGQLIDDMLTLSRITRADIKRERVDLSRLAAQILEELRTEQPDRNVEVKVSEHLAAQADPRQLRILLGNLVGNAWKFSGKTEHAQIEIGMMPTEKGHAFYVRDNGAGFDMNYAKNLFGAFQRLHDTDEFPGTGIGLAIAQRVVNRHGGDIWAEGAVGKGATFYFTL